MNLFCQRDSTDLDGCHNLYNPCHHVDEEQISEIGQALDGRRIHACVVTRWGNHIANIVRRFNEFVF